MAGQPHIRPVHPLLVSELCQAPQAPRIWVQIRAHHSRCSLICPLLRAARQPVGSGMGVGSLLKIRGHLQGSWEPAVFFPVPGTLSPSFSLVDVSPEASGLHLGSCCPSAHPVSLLQSLFVTPPLCAFIRTTLPLPLSLSLPFFHILLASAHCFPLLVPLGVSKGGHQAGPELRSRSPGLSSLFGKFCYHRTLQQGDRGPGW